MADMLLGVCWLYWSFYGILIYKKMWCLNIEVLKYFLTKKLY